jgi:hypothetical protein
MTGKLIALRTNALKTIEARKNGDAGQGSLEYIGAILVAAAVVGVVIAAAGDLDVGEAFTNALEAITSGGEGE